MMTLLIIVLVFSSGCSDETGNDRDDGGLQPVDTPEPPKEGIMVSFQYNRVPGAASNQFAIWVEDSEGDYVTTLFVTDFTSDGGWSFRQNSLLGWVEASDVSSKPEYVVDAVSGATPKPGLMRYYWDYTDEEGNAVPDGEYRIFLEGSIRWQDRILCSSIVFKGDPDKVIDTECNISGGTDAEKNMIVDVQMQRVNGSDVMAAQNVS
jgi:hypothetical protein